MALGPAEVAYGPYLIGLLLNVVLYGITITQTYLYYTSAKNRDRWQVQAFVYLLFVADTVQTIFSCISVYEGVIVHFGDVEYLQTGDWKFATEPALTGIIGGMVQMFFVRRLKVITKNNFLVLIVLACAISSILMGIATGAAIHFVPAFVEFQRFQVVVIIWLVSAATGDLLITTSLVIYLRRMKSGLPRSDSQVDKIVRLTIQTGLVTSIWAVIDLFVYLFNPTGLHLIFNTPLSKLYTNSLMSSLNARDFWRTAEDSDATSTGIFHGIQFASFARRVTLNREADRSLKVSPIHFYLCAFTYLRCLSFSASAQSSQLATHLHELVPDVIKHGHQYHRLNLHEGTPAIRTWLNLSGQHHGYPTITGVSRKDQVFYYGSTRRLE